MHLPWLMPKCCERRGRERDQCEEESPRCYRRGVDFDECDSSDMPSLMKIRGRDDRSHVFMNRMVRLYRQVRRGSQKI